MQLRLGWTTDRDPMHAKRVYELYLGARSCRTLDPDEKLGTGVRAPGRY